ncbi:MAG: tRNA-dihydrouridine synthase, partial [Shimia sp.]
RDIPPLDYALVRQMRAAFPDLEIEINGGIDDWTQVARHLDDGFAGVMVGRAAYHRPFDILAPVDRHLGEAAPPVDRAEVVARMRPHIAAHLAEGGSLHQVTRHMLGLFAGQPGARAWRRILSERATREGAGLEVVEAALDAVAHAQDGVAA